MASASTVFATPLIEKALQSAERPLTEGEIARIAGPVNAGQVKAVILPMIADGKVMIVTRPGDGKALYQMAAQKGEKGRTK